MTPSILRPLTDKLNDAELTAANRVLQAHGLKPLGDGARLFDALNQLSYCDTTTYVEGAKAIRKAIDHAK